MSKLDGVIRKLVLVDIERLRKEGKIVKMGVEEHGTERIANQ